MARHKLNNEQSVTARRILAAAERQFAAQGMAGARTDEIASAAHANKAMLYYYFGDKRRLHRAVLENFFASFAPESTHPRPADAVAAQTPVGIYQQLFRFSGVTSKLSSPGATRGYGSDQGF